MNSMSVADLLRGYDQSMTDGGSVAGGFNHSRTLKALQDMARLSGFAGEAATPTQYGATGMNEGGETSYASSGYAANPDLLKLLEGYRVQQNGNGYDASLLDQSGNSLGAFRSGDKASGLYKALDVAAPLAIGAMAGPALAGAFGGGMLGGAAAGSIIGGANAHMNDSSILKGALTGGLLGGATGGLGDAYGAAGGAKIAPIGSEATAFGGLPTLEGMAAGAPMETAFGSFGLPDASATALLGAQTIGAQVPPESGLNQMRQAELDGYQTNGSMPTSPAAPATGGGLLGQLGSTVSDAAKWMKDNPTLGRLIMAGGTSLLSSVGGSGSSGSSGQATYSGPAKKWSSPIQQGLLAPAQRAIPPQLSGLGLLNVAGQPNAGAWRFLGGK